MNSSLQCFFIRMKNVLSKGTDVFILLISLVIIAGSTAFAQTKRDTVWVGYDKGHSDPLYTWDGQNIGTAYAHPQAGWTYALKMDLTDFGTTVTTNDFYPIEMRFYVLVSSVFSGIVNRTMTAYVWDDSSGFPGKVSVTTPFTLIHRSVQYDTSVVIDLRSSIAKLRRKNPIWIGFAEGPVTNDTLFTWIRSSYAAGTETKSYQKISAGDWSKITQPVYYYPELRKSYNLYFHVRYIGDHPLDVDKTFAPSAAQIQLGQNYPNPFSGTTSIQFMLQNGSSLNNASLRIYDVLGREIASFDNQSFKQGLNQVVFSSGSLPNGLYHYILNHGKNTVAKAMVILH